MTQKDYGGTITIEFDAGGGIQDVSAQQSSSSKTCRSGFLPEVCQISSGIPDGAAAGAASPPDLIFSRYLRELSNGLSRLGL